MILHSSHVQLYKKLMRSFIGIKGRCYEHCRQRALERYKFDLSHYDYDCILKILRNQDKEENTNVSECLYELKDKTKVWAIYYKKKWFKVMFSVAKRGEWFVSTFLPRDAKY